MNQRASRLLLVVVLRFIAAHDASATEPQVITNTIDMKLVEVPAGEFMMGAEEERADTLNKFPYCNPNWLEGELPKHKVRITKPFYMGQYEVTLKEFMKFCDDAKYKIEAERDGEPSLGYKNHKIIESNLFRPWNPIAWDIEMDHPAIYVSWNDAVAFCEWLSKKEGQTYRLPTEAEWEYACRAGSSSRYCFGDDPEEMFRFANAADAVAKANMPDATIAIYNNMRKKISTKIPFPYLTKPDGYVWTAPVGTFRPNAFGLYDMHGNAWEWCSDWYSAEYYKSSPTDDPQGPRIGKTRVHRGGGCLNTSVCLRCAFRQDDSPWFREFKGGFRVVRVY